MALNHIRQRAYPVENTPAYLLEASVMKKKVSK
jgi:hypothetical protein